MRVFRLSICVFLDPARSSRTTSDLKTTKERLRWKQGLYGGLTCVINPLCIQNFRPHGNVP